MWRILGCVVVRSYVLSVVSVPAALPAEEIAVLDD